LFDPKEIDNWEHALKETIEKRIFKTSKEFKCPRTENLKDYRNHRSSSYWFRHESKLARKKVQRKFRRRSKINVYKEEFFKVIPHDYRTYGRETW
jgi:hypothetical protein